MVSTFTRSSSLHLHHSKELRIQTMTIDSHSRVEVGGREMMTHPYPPLSKIKSSQSFCLCSSYVTDKTLSSIFEWFTNSDGYINELHDQDNLPVMRVSGIVAIGGAWDVANISHQLDKFRLPWKEFNDDYLVNAIKDDDISRNAADSQQKKEKDNKMPKPD
eukprot:9765456-Ditylum_brightwellii.AAC.1